jgi:hypothetical protein
MMMQQMMQFEAYMPHFSGFSSAEWGSLISGPQHKAAQGYAKDEAGEYGLDCQDYLNIFEQIGVSEKQRSLLAQEFCKSFKIRLAHALESPHGLQFERYDFDADRIVVSIPLSTVRRLVMLFKLVELAPLLHFAPDAGDAEPAVAECLNRLDHTFVCSMLGASTKGSFEKQELANMAGLEASRVFNQSVDWVKFRSMTKARRREKRQSAALTAQGLIGSSTP